MFIKEVCKKIGCIIKGAKEIEWLNKSSGVELGPGPEGSATRRILIGALPFDDSHAERIRSRLVVADVIFEEEEVDASGVSEVCAIDKDFGNGIPRVSPEFRCRVELCARNLRKSWGPYPESQKRFVGLLRSERTG